MFQVRTQLDPLLNKHLEDSKFEMYYNLLISANNQTNLTRITDIDEVYYRHFYDSMILSKYIDLNGKCLLDVGAGAGFPSLPLKIVQPNLDVTIIDSLGKRIRFLNDLVDSLDLKQVQLIHGRAEEWNYKNHYDIVVSRAVARLSILIELTLPFVKPGGMFVAYKSIQYEEELHEALNGIQILGGKLDHVQSYQVSLQETHVLIFILKIKPTDTNYPRLFGKIKKQPL
ncbi:MAG: 16S rRNA (guanine(527)-N(7))-methyltransferase RsmG [Bacilli bacterium]|nr:16S rRNA (guanine(527)-N(7))-methyltransferase RsmG [Bacilli bacterium]